MNHANFSPLTRAFAASLILHAGAFAFGAYLAALLPAKVRPPGPALKVRLAEPLAVPAPQPELRMREDNPPAAPAAAKAPPKRAAEREAERLTRPPQAAPSPIAQAGIRILSGEAASKAREQIARELFYPPEAIARGQEGEVLVLLFLDAAGDAIAARVEASSGHPLLDEAAVRAARTLRALPASAAREALVPVRFRLR